MFAVDLPTGAYTPDRDLHVGEALIQEGFNVQIKDLWSDGETLWVLGDYAVDSSDTGGARAGRLFAFDLATGTRRTARDVDWGEGRPHVRFTSDGLTLWIPDGLRSYDRKVLAYVWPGGGGGGGFIDPVLVTGDTAIKAVHVTELRERINACRIRFGLPAFSWTDSTIVGGVTPIRAVHFSELRIALDQAYSAAGRSRPAYTDPLLSAGTPMRGVHVDELRLAVMLLE